MLDSLIPIRNPFQGLEDWLNESEGDKYRLTLLNRDNDTSYFAITDSVTELKDPKEKTFVAFLKLNKNTNIQIRYDVSIETLDDVLLATSTSTIDASEKKEIIPFRIHAQMPSHLVNKKILSTLEDYCEAQLNEFEGHLKDLEENSFLKAIFKSYAKRKNEHSKEKKRLSQILSHEITSYFHEDDSPSIRLNEDEIKEISKAINCEVMYKSSISLKKIIAGTVVYAITPQCAMKKAIDEIAKKCSTEQKEFYQFEGNHLLFTKFKKAATKALIGYKHLANAACYTTLATSATTAYLIIPNLITKTAMMGIAASGITMATNYCISKGENSSGIISSILDRMYKKYMK